MKTIFSIFLLLGFLSTHLYAQSERSRAIVIPISSIGSLSDSEKLILQNTLESKLDNFFQLISKEKFEEAQEQAFKELDYDECTEDKCIMLIQEMLQVENIFQLQVITYNKDSQLSLSWRTLDEKKKETYVCKGCTTFEINDKIEDLVLKFFDNDKKNISLSKNIKEKKIKSLHLKRLGLRSNEGNLSTRFLNPPIISDTRLYSSLGYVFYSNQYHKYSELDSDNYYKDTDIYFGIDQKLFTDKMNYVSFSYSTSESQFNTNTRYDYVANNVNYFRKRNFNNTYKNEYIRLEYVHQLSDTFIGGISYNTTSLIKNIKYDFQWYNADNNSTTGLNSGTKKYDSEHNYSYQGIRLQKVFENLRLDFLFFPEVTSKEKYSGDYTGESVIGFGRILGINFTIIENQFDYSFGYYKESQNSDTNDSENTSYIFGYNNFLKSEENLILKGEIEYNKSDGISGEVKPATSIIIDGKVFFDKDLNTYFVNYIYINHKYDNLGDSSDKYRVDEQHVNDLYVGIILNF